jgi:hypothetical protein
MFKQILTQGNLTKVQDNIFSELGFEVRYYNYNHDRIDDYVDLLYTVSYLEDSEGIAVESFVFCFTFKLGQDHCVLGLYIEDEDAGMDYLHEIKVNELRFDIAINTFLDTLKDDDRYLKTSKEHSEKHKSIIDIAKDLSEIINK